MQIAHPITLVVPWVNFTDKEATFTRLENEQNLTVVKTDELVDWLVGWQKVDCKARPFSWWPLFGLFRAPTTTMSKLSSLNSKLLLF